MLTKSGAKLLDFGLAKLRGPATPITMSGMTRTTTTPTTAEGTIVGTIHYMAPEQVEGREADKRSDVWALGAVLYETATGTRPFDGASAASVIGGILKDTPKPVSARQPLTPPSFDHVVERCLEKDPDDRWQDAGDVRRELQWIAHSVARPEADKPSHAPSRRSVSTWIAAGLVVAALLALAVVLRRPPPSEVRAERMVLSIVPLIRFDLVARSRCRQTESAWFSSDLAPTVHRRSGSARSIRPSLSSFPAPRTRRTRSGRLRAMLWDSLLEGN